jgi:hypothetical protein
MEKGITYQIVIRLVAKILGLILPEVSNSIKELLQTYIRDLYKKACETPNPVDDLFVKLIAEILGIKLEEK